MPNAQELYASAVRDMSAEERLRLAALILNDLTHPKEQALDFEDEWTEEDLREMTQYVLKRAEILYPCEEELV